MRAEVNTRDTEARSLDLLSLIDAVNIAERLDESELGRIGQKVVEEYDLDLASRKANGWEQRTEAAMKLALQAKEAKNYPWPGAANVKYPLVTVAAIQFNARAYPAIVDGGQVVKGKVYGKPSEEKQQRADRVAKHMSYQLMEEMTGWEEDTDRLLIMLPIVGTVVRKSYFDPLKGTNCSELIGPDKFVVNYWTKDLETCPRGTHVRDFYPHEVEEKIRSEVWSKIDLGIAPSKDNDEQAPHEFLEQHRLLDLDDDGYPEPYIVTVHKETSKVVRIVARYDADGVQINGRREVIRIKPVRYFTKYGFIPSPDGAFYDIGFGQLLDALNETINSTINQLLDAGHLSNVQGGFLGAGVSIKSGALRFQPGEWKKVDTGGNPLRESIVPVPVAPPSTVLFQLLGMLIESAKDITATKDILTGETQGNDQAVGTTLAMIEQGLKVFTAIYKRIHRALKQELACLRRLNKLYLDPEVYFTFQDVQGVVAKADYEDKDCDVVPVSDPTVVTDMQRIGRAQFLMQFKGDPTIDQVELNRRILNGASIDDVDGLFVKETRPDPAIEFKRVELQQKEAQITLDRRKQAVAEAEAKARMTKLRAETLVAIQGVGGGTAVTDPETGVVTEQPAPVTNIDPAAVAALAAMDGDIDAEVEEAVARAEDNEVQPGDVPGMEGPPADAGVPALPEGPTGGAGQDMDVGPADVPEPAGQGAIDGGAIPPGMA